MASVHELFPKSRKLAYDARQQLSQVQNSLLHPTTLFLSLDELNRQLDIMENLVNRETPAQRDMWRYKISELRQEAQSIRIQGERYDRMVGTNVRRQKEREELLLRRRGGNRRGEENALDDLVGEEASLAQSRNMVGELLASGSESLNSLVEQRRRLKGVNRVIFDIGNRLGLSNSTMRIIERRDVTDAYLVFAGMVVTLLVIYFLYF